MPGPWHLEFNGDTSDLNCHDDAALRNLPAGQFAAEAWVRADTYGEGGSGQIFDKDGGTTGWFLSTDSINGLITYIYCATNSARVFTGRDDFTADGLWHHVAMTFDGTLLPAGNPVIRMWVDGNEVSYNIQNPGVGNYVADTAIDLRIGNDPPGNQCFDGGIGWARISDNLRYTANFEPPVRCGLPDIDANTVAQWICEGVGAIAYDQVGDPNKDGDIANCVWARDCPGVIGPRRGSIQRRWQTPFLKKAWTLEPFDYAGDCARVGSGSMSLGDVRWSVPTTVPSGRGVGDSELVEEPGAVSNQLTLKKSVYKLLDVEEWLENRWHVDVRLQVDLSKTRDDPFNWLMVDRYWRTKFTQYGTDDETTYTEDDDAIVLVTLPFVAPPLSLKRIFRLAEAATTHPGEAVRCLAHVQCAQSPTATSSESGHRVIAGTNSVGGNPAFGISDDGGGTWTWITFNGANNTPNWTNPITGVAGSGGWYIAVSEGMAAHAVSQDGGLTWTTVVLEGYATRAPYQIVLHSLTSVWICGSLGYVWRSTDGGLTGSISHAGTQVDRSLLKIRALTDRFVVAVGEQNAILRYDSGVWTAVAGPGAQAAVHAYDVALATPLLWAIVYADGELYWTDDGAATWTLDAQLSLDTLWAIVYSPYERWIVVGEKTAQCLVFENVHGAPNKWESVPLDTSFAGVYYDVILCELNHYVACGFVAGNVGLISVLKVV